MKSKLSIIIPTLNESKHLPLLLKDLSKQTNRDFEVIVVDGDSDDDTRSVAEGFNKTIQITVINAHKRHLSYQRNLGAEHAKGDYVVFIDADSRVRRSFVNSIFRVLKKQKHLVILPVFDTNVSGVAEKTLFSVTNYMLDISQLLRLPFTPGACLIFEKHFFLFVGGFRITKKQKKKKLFPEDVDILKRVLACGVIPYLASEVKFSFSMRRFKKEGFLKVFTTYTLSAINMLTRGKMDFDIEYRMGGDYYKRRLRVDKKSDLVNKLKTMLSRVKKILE